MVIKENGKSHIEVVFFDGIYEVTRRCYSIGCGMFRISDVCNGEIWEVTKGYKDHVSYYFDADTAIDIMAETCEMDESDKLWIINHGYAKLHLSSVYGRMDREDK